MRRSAASPRSRLELRRVPEPLLCRTANFRRWKRHRDRSWRKAPERSPHRNPATLAPVAHIPVVPVLGLRRNPYCGDVDSSAQMGVCHVRRGASCFPPLLLRRAFCRMGDWNILARTSSRQKCRIESQQDLQSSSSFFQAPSRDDNSMTETQTELFFQSRENPARNRPAQQSQSFWKPGSNARSHLINGKLPYRLALATGQA
jgi:hypothetical protein